VTLAPTSGFLLMGEVASENLVLDNNEIQARNNGAASQLYLQKEGGDLSIHYGGGAAEFRVAASGSVGIGTGAPTSKLDVRGNIRLGNNGELNAVGSDQSLRMITGRVTAGGSKAQGGGFTCIKIGSGQYAINFDVSFSAEPIVVATLYGNDVDNIITVTTATAAGFLVQIRDITTGGSSAQDGSFNFIATGLR